MSSNKSQLGANFRWFFAAQLTNFAGTSMATLALTFATLDINSSPTALGWVLAAHTVPMVLFLLVGGVVADRFDRARIIQLSNLGAVLTQGVTATLVLTGAAEIWMLVVLGAVNGLLSAIAIPAITAVLPELVDEADLQTANAYISISRGVLTIVGPSLSAALVVSVGPGWALAADAFAWLMSFALMRQVRLPPRTTTESGEPSIAAELRVGWRLFHTTSWLWLFVLACAPLNAIQEGSWLTLGPAVARGTIGEQGWGLVVSAEAFGVLVMALILTRIRIRRSLVSASIGVALLGLPLMALGLGSDVIWIAVLAAVSGMGAELYIIGWNVTMQTKIRSDMLSRAYSYDAIVSFSVIPIGQLAVGPLAAHYGFARVLVASGVIYMVVALIPLLDRSVRSMRVDAVEESTETVQSGSRA